MMKKYITDFLFAALLLVIFPLFVVGRPDINYNVVTSIVETLEVETHEDLSVSKVKNKRKYSNIKERNIFSPDGSYKTIEGKKKSDYEAYRFIGVVISGQKRAVFIKENGNIVSLKTGDKLEDGSVISSIENLSVKLKKNDKVVEYRIFKLENEIN